jgi:hypothetical protein
MEWSCVLYVPAALLPGKVPPVPIGSWMSPEVGLDALGKRKICCFHRESSHEFSIFEPAVCNILTTLSLKPCQTVFVLVVSTTN